MRDVARNFPATRGARLRTEAHHLRRARKAACRRDFSPPQLLLIVIVIERPRHRPRRAFPATIHTRQAQICKSTPDRCASPTLRARTGAQQLPAVVHSAPMPPLFRSRSPCGKDLLLEDAPPSTSRVFFLPKFFFFFSSSTFRMIFSFCPSAC